MKKCLFWLFFVLLIILTSCSNVSKNNIAADDSDVAVVSGEPDNIGGGSSGECPVHGSGTYHSIPGSLLEAVSEEDFGTWLASLPDDYNVNGCNSACNVVSFIEHFGFSDQELEEAAYGAEYYSSPWWDIEALLARDYDKFEKSGRLENYDYDECNKRSSEFAIKIHLLDYLRDSKNAEWVELYNTLTDGGKFYKVYEWSFAELVYHTGITQNVLEELVEEQSYNEFLDTPVLVYEYDFSPIYEGDGLREEIKTMHPVQVDELLRQ